MEKKIKLGLVGAGHMGQYHVKIALSIDDYELVGIYDDDNQRSEKIAKSFDVFAFQGLDELLSRVEAVLIAVPTALHYETALQALRGNKHVLVEKPMTETVEQAQELVALSEEKKLVFQVGHVERFNGAVLELGRIVNAPSLIETRRLAPFNNRIQDVGVVLDLMIHDIDIVLNLVNSKIDSVHACGTSCLSQHEDIAVATIQFESGCVANFVASRMAQTKVRSLNITQENSYIVLDFSTQDIDIHRRSSSAYLMTREELKYKQESFVERIEVRRDNPLKQEHEHFIACIRGFQNPIVGGQEELRTLKITGDILQHIGKKLSLKLG